MIQAAHSPALTLLAAALAATAGVAIVATAARAQASTRIPGTYVCHAGRLVGLQLELPAIPEPMAVTLRIDPGACGLQT